MPDFRLHIRLKTLHAKAWGYRLFALPAHRLIARFKTGSKGPIGTRTRVLTGARDPEMFEKFFGRARYDQIVADAERILRHQFKIFVDFPVDASPKIDWSRDYAANLNFTRTFYKSVRLRDFDRPDDPKVPWELSRFHHGISLGMAFVLTRDERYAKGFLDSFESWMTENPARFGVNWTCAMEVAIRACNLIVAFDMLQESKSVSGRHTFLLEKSLKQHLTYIMENLEWNARATTNHYISDLLGLIFIGALFPEIGRSGNVLEFACDELESEIDKQFYADGGNWESSSTYQRFVVEMIFFAFGILEKNGRPIKPHLVDRIGRSVVMLNHLSDAAGNIPQIGDNDSGRFLPFLERKDTDVRHLGALYAVLTGDGRFLWDSEPREEVFWVFGVEGVSMLREFRNTDRNPRGSMAFPDAGWYVMKNGQAQVVASLAPNGQNGSGGHCHNDKLSITAAIGGIPALIDPGTHVYKADVAQRFRFRSTSAHNTVTIEGEEQNRFEDGWLFRIHQDAVPILESWMTRPDKDQLACHHSGYQRLKGQITHKRSICFSKEQSAWVVVDRITATKRDDQPRLVEWNWHTAMETLEDLDQFPPEGRFNFLDEPIRGDLPKQLALSNGFRIPLGERSLCVLALSDEVLERDFEENNYSVSYRRKDPGMTVVYRSKSSLPLVVQTYFWVTSTRS